MKVLADPVEIIALARQSMCLTLHGEKCLLHSVAHEIPSESWHLEIREVNGKEVWEWAGSKFGPSERRPALRFGGFVNVFGYKIAIPRPRNASSLTAQRAFYHDEMVEIAQSGGRRLTDKGFKMVFDSAEKWALEYEPGKEHRPVFWFENATPDKAPVPAVSGGVFVDPSGQPIEFEK